MIATPIGYMNPTTPTISMPFKFLLIVNAEAIFQIAAKSALDSWIVAHEYMTPPDKRRLPNVSDIVDEIVKPGASEVYSFACLLRELDETFDIPALRLLQDAVEAEFDSRLRGSPETLEDLIENSGDPIRSFMEYKLGDLQDIVRAGADLRLVCD